MTVIARRLRLRQGHRYPRHAHDRWSFGLPTSGSVRLWSAGSWYTVVPGVATVLPPGEAHEGMAGQLHGLEYVTISVTVNLVATVFGTGRRPVFEGLLGPVGPIGQLLAATRDPTPEERRERTLAALAMVFADTPTTASSRSERNVTAAAKRLIDATLPERVRVTDVAQTLGVAPATLIRGFRRQHGMPPYAYVISRRVDLARRLLEAGTTPAAAAHHAGFYDQAHLNRHFARVVGVTPGAYRQG